MASYWTAEVSRQRAARSYQLAEETTLPKLKQVLIRDAEGWLRLAAEQERFESRACQGSATDRAETRNRSRRVR